MSENGTKNGIYVYLDEQDKKAAQVVINGVPYPLVMTGDLEALDPGFYEQGEEEEEQAEAQK